MCPCNIISKWQFSRSKNYYFYMIFNFFYHTYLLWVTTYIIFMLFWPLLSIFHEMTKLTTPPFFWPNIIFSLWYVTPKSILSMHHWPHLLRIWNFSPVVPSNFFDNVWACEVNTPAPAHTKTATVSPWIVQKSFQNRTSIVL